MLDRPGGMAVLAALVAMLLAVPCAFAQTSNAPGKTAAPAQAKTSQTASSQPQGSAGTGQQQGGGGVAGPTGAFSGLSKNSGQPINIESDVLYVHDAQKYATFKGNVKAVQGTTILHSKELDVHYVGGGSDSLTTGSDASGQNGAANGASGGAAATATPVKITAQAQAPGSHAASGAAAAGAQGPQAAAANGQAANGAQGAAGGASLGDGSTKITKIYARGDVVITSDQDQTTTGEWAIYDVPAQMVTVGGNVVLTQGKNVLKGDRLLIDLTTGESRFENPGSTAGRRIRALFIPKQDANSGDASKDQSGNGKADGQKSADAKSDDAKGEPKAASEKAGEKPAGAAAPDDASPWQLIPSSPQ